MEDEEKFKLQGACGRIRAHKFELMEMFEKEGCESSEFLENLTTEYARRILHVSKVSSTLIVWPRGSTFFGTGR